MYYCLGSLKYFRIWGTGYKDNIKYLFLAPQLSLVICKAFSVCFRPLSIHAKAVIHVISVLQHCQFIPSDTFWSCSLCLENVCSTSQALFHFIHLLLRCYLLREVVLSSYSHPLCSVTDTLLSQFIFCHSIYCFNLYVFLCSRM